MIALAFASILAQDPAAQATSPHDRVVPLVITADSPVIDGHGRGVTFEHTTSFRGTLNVWTRVDGEFDTFLRVVANGRLQFEDDDDGGKPTPLLHLGVYPGTKLVFTVMAAQPPGTGAVETGKVEVVMRAAPTSEATTAAAKAAEQELAAITTLRKGGNRAAAAERMTALGERLFALDEAAMDDELDVVFDAAQKECSQLGGIQPAERLRRRSLRYRERMLPGTCRSVLVAQLNYAVSLNALARPQEARDLLEHALAVATATLPEDDLLLRSGLQNLAGYLGRCGELSRAREVAERLVALCSRVLPPDDEGLLQARNALAAAFNELGDLEGARAQQEQILATCGRVLAPDNPTRLAATMNLANTLSRLGDDVRARALKETVLEMQERSPATTPIELATTKLNLGATLYFMGDRAAARAQLEDARTKSEGVVPQSHLLVQMLDLNLAAVLLDAGEYAAAAALLERLIGTGVAALGETSIPTAMARVQLATTLMLSGDAVRARPHAEAGLAVLVAALGESDARVQTTREVLACIEDHDGNHDTARQLSEAILAARLRLLPEDHVDVQTARLNLVERTAMQGRILLDADANAASTADFAALDRRFHDLATALATGLQHGARRASLASSSRGAEEVCVVLEPKLSRLLSYVAGFDVFASAPELERAAFATAETMRGAGLASARQRNLMQGDPRREELLQQLAASSTELARIAQGRAAPEQLAAAVAGRDRIEQALAELASGAGGGEAALDPDAVAATLGPRTAVVAYRRYLRLLLPPGARSDKGLDSVCAHVLRADGTLLRFELGDFESVEAAVRGWRDAVGAPLDGGRAREPAAEGSQWVQTAGEALRRLVLDPLLPALDGVDRLVLLPDDVLHAVPIDALPLPRDATRDGTAAKDATASKPCGERWRIEVQLSLLQPGAALSHSGPPTVLALGGAAFDAAPQPFEATAGTVDAGGSPSDATESVARGTAAILRGGPWEHGFAPLPASADEARGVAALAREAFGDAVRATVLDAQRASRDAVAVLAPKAQWVHLATHGWFAPGSIASWSAVPDAAAAAAMAATGSVDNRIRGMSPMLLCGLALAGANLPADACGRSTGLITAEEIAAWDLTGCELAVLSACDTNVGTRRAGQGVASLQKALHMAGARSVVTSLWKVPDTATKELMLDFYRRLWIGRQPKGAALWAAKMHLRAATDEFGRPRYTPRDWAAWVLTGAPD